jgi:hypothetical protein
MKTARDVTYAGAFTRLKGPLLLPIWKRAGTYMSLPVICLRKLLKNTINIASLGKYAGPNNI